jgi:hypothetical protein
MCEILEYVQAHAYIVSPRGAEKLLRLTDRIRSNIIAFDELTSGLSGMHIRSDLNELFADGFQMYSTRRKLVWQDPNDHIHDTML